MATKVKINGVVHTMTISDRGEAIYDPPLSKTEIDRGQKNMREMLAERKFPGVKTESTFFNGRGTLDQQFKDDPWYLERIIEGARARGYEPNPNDVYLTQLADGDGDPAAFISQADGMSKIRKVCESKRLYCEDVGTERYDVTPAPPIRLAEELVQEKMTEYRSDPEHSMMSDQELREFVVDKHGARI